MRKLHKLFLSLGLILTLNACANSPVYLAGSKDADGKEQGPYTIYSKDNNMVLGKGQFRDGHPDGLWTLWNNAGFKVAELNYKYGLIDGEYKIYFTDQRPEDKNKLASKGHLINGRLGGGMFEAYDVQGNLTTRFTVENDRVAEVLYGDPAIAYRQLAAEIKVLQIDNARVLGRI